ncbi:MAG: ParB/RepB/Spo0J family partition protein [Spirochaetia bacterium]|nr:ParB/RepB/Spo0J family partition protein [Spirochaetia bacterium]
MSNEKLTRLGRGYDALIPNAGTIKNQETNFVDIQLIIPNPDQPRKDFDQAALQELANSIKEKGILQPILVEKTDDKYLIIAGERRYRAALMAHLTQVPIITGRFSKQEKLEIALIENIQRKDLTPIEEALAYEALMKNSNLNQDELAKKVGKNRSTIANSLRLLKLSDQMKEAVSRGTLTAGHARAILSVDSKENQQKLFEAIEKKDLSVREAEAMATKLNQEDANAVNPKLYNSRKDPEMAATEKRFAEKLGTKVALKGTMKKGKLEISYKTKEELLHLYEMLGR